MEGGGEEERIGDVREERGRRRGGDGGRRRWRKEAGAGVSETWAQCKPSVGWLESIQKYNKYITLSECK